MTANAIGDNMKHHQKYVERKDLWWLGNTSMWRKIINSENVKILKHKAFFFSITSHTYTTAIVDTSTTDDFFPLSLESLTNIQQEPSIQVELPDGSPINSIGTATLTNINLPKK